MSASEITTELAWRAMEASNTAFDTFNAAKGELEQITSPEKIRILPVKTL